MVSDVPFAATKLVWPVNSPLVPSSRSMHCTGQVSKVETRGKTSEGWLKIPDAEAMIWVCPGAPGDRVTWLVATLREGFKIGAKLATFGLLAVQVKVPTEGVMSFPLASRAVACKVSIWLVERQEQEKV